MNSKDTSVHCSHMVAFVHKALSPPVFGYFKYANTEVRGRSGKSSHMQ